MKCTKSQDKVLNEEVLSKQLQWLPLGAQADKYKSKPLRPVHDDILIAKLRPGQVAIANER